MMSKIQLGGHAFGVPDLKWEMERKALEQQQTPVCKHSAPRYIFFIPSSITSHPVIYI